MLSILAFLQRRHGDEELNIKDFFEKIEQQIDMNTLDEFCASGIDSTGSCFKLIEREFEREYYKLDRDSKIIRNLDTLQILTDPVRIKILEIQFYYNANHRVASFFDIYKNMNKMNNYYNWDSLNRP